MNEDKTRSEMDEVLNLVSSDISTIRTGRATPSLVEEIVINAYGGTQKLKVMELASITAIDAQTLVVSPWDKSIIGEIKQGILAANAGLNPVIDGEIIRIVLPALTTEDREKYIRLLKQKLESGKVMIRRIRSDVMRDIKDLFEKKALSEDEKFAQEKKVQGLTDEFVEKISEMGEEKQAELLQI